MKKIGTLIIASAVCIGAVPAYANLISNGDFSANPPSSGCAAGVTSLPDWSVTSGNVDVVSGNACQTPAAPGGTTYYLDLTGSFAEYGVNDVGVIAQTFATTIGSKYSVNFYFGGNAGWQYLPQYPNDSPTKSMNALVDGNIEGTYSINTTGVAETNAQWQLENFSFLATSTNTTLSFQSLNGVTTPSDFGAFLADVQVETVAPTVRAPELNISSLAAALTLLFGGLVVTTERRFRT